MTILGKSNSVSPTKTQYARNGSKKRLRFHQIEIIELPISIGDNPCVTDGPPVACSWDTQLRVTINLDFFEQHRPKRRAIPQLILSRRTRERLLQKQGFSEGDISQATLEARRAKFDRMMSLKLGTFESQQKSVNVRRIQRVAATA